MQRRRYEFKLSGANFQKMLWDTQLFLMKLEKKSNLGEDNLKLFFEINKKADLLVQCFDIKDEFLGEYNL